MRGFFITGTDTGIGKTWVSQGLMAALQEQGYRVGAMKPIASGCRPTEGGLRNDDALHLIHQAKIPLSYGQVNPYAFEPAIAPHIAAREAGVEISLTRIRRLCAEISSVTDITIVEGVGGWLVPLNDDETVANLALALDLPVIMVVGIRLGCLNQALLTAESISRSGACLAGWVANLVERDTERVVENIATLEGLIGAPLLGTIPYMEQFNLTTLVKQLNQDLSRFLK